MDQTTHDARPRSSGTDLVRLTISPVVLSPLGPGGPPVLDVNEIQPVAIERAVAWAKVRGYDKLVGTITAVFDAEPPESGFTTIINKPHQLIVIATWPWAPSGQRSQDGDAK